MPRTERSGSGGAWAVVSGALAAAILAVLFGGGRGLVVPTAGDLGRTPTGRVAAMVTSDVDVTHLLGWWEEQQRVRARMTVLEHYWNLEQAAMAEAVDPLNRSASPVR